MEFHPKVLIGIISWRHGSRSRPCWITCSQAWKVDRGIFLIFKSSVSYELAFAPYVWEAENFNYRESTLWSFKVAEVEKREEKRVTLPGTCRWTISLHRVLVISFPRNGIITRIHHWMGGTDLVSLHIHKVWIEWRRAAPPPQALAKFGGKNNR